MGNLDSKPHFADIISKAIGKLMYLFLYCVLCARSSWDGVYKI